MKSFYPNLLVMLVFVFVSTKGEDDAIIVEDDSETSESGSAPVQTRLFTGNDQLDAGLAGLAIGVGGALVVGHLLGEAEKNKVHCQRYKRDAEEPSTRFLNFGGGGSQKCPPGTYPARQQQSYGHNNYQAPYPNHGPVYPTQGPYQPQPFYPPQNGYNTPYPARRPTHGPSRRPVHSPYKNPSPYEPYAPSQGYNPGPYPNQQQYNTPYIQRHSSQKTNGYRVPSSPVTRPTLDHQGSFFSARSNVKDNSVVESTSTANKLNGKKRSDAVRFV